MKTTREEDLSKLDDSRFNRKEQGSKEHVESIMAVVHAQSKDPMLELMRAELVSILQQLEEQGESDELWNKYMSQVTKIEKYCNSPSFIIRMTEAIAKQVNKTEANLYFRKMTEGGENKQ